ncbi:MAG: FG-GAP-like repeat-containing protein, partial [Anaerolineae bacterium]
MSHLLHKRTVSRLLGGGLACTLLILLFSLLLLAATPSRADNLSAPPALPMAGAPDQPVAPAMRSSLVSTPTIPAWARELLKGNAPTSGDDLIITKSAATAESAASEGSATVVVNGEYISYTLTFTNPSASEPASDILILDILPEESLSNIGCSDDCNKVVESQEIPDPFGNMIIVTVTRQVSWTLDSLAPGKVQTRRLWGRVIGQTDGTELRNRAFMSYVQAGTSKSTVSNDARTTVRVRIDEDGQSSLSDAPNWLSEDLGGTLSMDWGDYDGDGYLDLALGSTIGTSIYRNDQGRLVRVWENERVTYGVSWGDFDGDGELELAAVGDSLDQTWVTSGTNYIYDLIGETVEAYEFTSNEQLVRVAPGDYDNDGLLDLLVSTNSINAPCPIQMYKNSGDPAAPFDDTPICIGTEATAALGPVDYDGDGDLDLAIGVFPNQTRLLINETLTAPNPFAATTPLVLDQRGPFLPYDFAWGDYNGDGFLDLAAALPLDRRVRIYRNVAGSTLVPDAEIPTSMFRTPLAVGWGDLNGDGRIDLAVADAPPRVYEYRDGKFQELLALPADSARGQSWSLGIVDIDNEGDLDLALTNRDGPSMLFSNFASLLAPTLSPVAATGSTAAASVAWADVDGDHDLDLLFGASQTTVGAKRYLNVLGSFPSSGMVSLSGSGFGPHAVAFGDVNADGQQDIALGPGTETGVQIYHNGNTETPDWTSSPPSRFKSRSVAWGDFDNDRYLDFAVGNDGQPNQVYRNNHDNTFALIWTSSYISNTRSVAWGDYDGDGDLDLAVGNNGQPNLIYENVAGNLTQAEAWRSLAVRNTTSLAWGDWDNDGDLDLAVGNDSQPDQVYENLDSKPGLPPRFYWLWASAESYGTSGVAWGDADGDGDLDLAVSSRTSGQSGVYHNTYVNPSHLTSAFAPTIPLPNNPSYVSVERPGSTAGAYFYSSADLLSGPKHPTVTVSYELYDPDGTRDDSTPSNQPGDPILSTAYEFSLDGAGTWNAATPMEAQASPTATQRLGQSASFSWDAIADAAISDDARFRVCIVQQNQADPVQRGMGCAVSPPFRVRGTSCVWPRDPTVVVSDLTPDPGDTVRFQGTVAEGSGILTYTWDFGDGTADQGQVVYHTFDNSNTYLVKLTVRSQPCPIAKEVVAVRTVVVGTGQPKIFVPIVANVATTTTTLPSSAAGREKAGISSPPPSQPRADDGPSSGQTVGEAGLTTLAGSPDPWRSYPPEEIQFDRQVPLAPGPGISLSVLNGSAPVFGLLPVTKDTKGINNYPSLSGDGRRLAFWSTDDLINSGSNADGNIEIFVADVGANDRVTLTQITESTGNILGGFNLSPALSDDGTRVTFFSDCDLAPAAGPSQVLSAGNQDANFEIYYATAGDWTPEQLTETGIGANVMPSISRDGGLIAFASDRNLDPATGNDDYNQEIFVYNAGLDRFIQISHTTGSILNNDPVISAEGHHVAYISDGELIVAELTAGGIVRTTVPNPSGGPNRQPASSADGRSIAFISGDDLWLAEFGAAGPMTMTQITDSPGALIDEPAISADGSRVAFVSNGKLFLYDKEVNLVSQVSNVSNARRPSLSADGTVLAFVSDREIFVTTSPRADLAVSKVSEPYPLVPGRGLTYTVVIANLGPSNAISTTVVDEIPSAVKNPMWTCTASPGSACQGELASATGAGYLINETVHVWAGTTITYVITGTLDASVADEVSNTVVVSVSQDLIDWRPNNNRSTDTSSASPVADLIVVKSVDDAHPNEGTRLSYTLVVTNTGPSDARGTQLTDTLPVGVTHVSHDESPGTTYADGLWTIGLLRTGMSATLTIVADVEAGTGGQTIVNRAEELRSDASDPDLSNNQASASLTVNRSPQANDDTANTPEDQAVGIDVLDNDGDPDGSLDPASLAVLTLPDNGTAVVDPITEIITYTPSPDWHGDDAFEYEICDHDNACDTAIVSVTVYSVNDAPTFTAGPDQAVDEDAGPQTVDSWATNISVGAPYEEGQTLTFATTNDNNALFAVQPSVDAPTGTLTYESAPDAFGQAVVTVILHDDGGTANGGDDTSDPQTFTITIQPVNDPPTLDLLFPLTITEDAGRQTVPLTGISAGPSGESQTLTVTASSSNPALIPDPTVAYTSPNPTGSLYFTPTANANGSVTLTVTVSDGLSDTQRAFLVTINAVNDPPVAVDDMDGTLEDTPLVLDVLANDSDVDNDPLTITAVGPA